MSTQFNHAGGALREGAKMNWLLITVCRSADRLLAKTTPLLFIMHTDRIINIKYT